jgi:DNA-binding transcriptional regulator YiaG
MQPMATLCNDVKPQEFKRIREALGLTQGQLAEEIGVHRVTVAKWEAGDRGIPEPVARLLSRIRAEKKRKK